MRTPARRLAKSAIRASYPLWSANAALSKRSRLFKPLVVHLAERGWVLDEVRTAICRSLRQHYTFMPALLSKYMWTSTRDSIVHFGTSGPYATHAYYLQVHPSNRQVITWTHGQRSNPDPTFAQKTRFNRRSIRICRQDYRHFESWSKHADIRRGRSKQGLLHSAWHRHAVVHSTYGRAESINAKRTGYTSHGLLHWLFSKGWRRMG